LEVRSDNQKAIHLYEKMGFKKWGTYERFFKIEKQYCDAEYMNLYLDSEK
jgi:RimJ/RimL family protein N-acetyltransferase